MHDKRLNAHIGQKGYHSAAPGTLDSLMKDNVAGRFNGKSLAQVLKVDQ